MIIVITNKYKEKIAISEIRRLPYKCASGYYPAMTFAKNLSKFKIDTLIVDVTALHDISLGSTWDTLITLVDPSRIFVLLEANKSYKSASFFAMLIAKGIYNFAKSPGEIADLIENPQTYEDVEEYCRIAEDEEAKRLKSQERFEEIEKKTLERQEAMQNYLVDAQSDNFNKPKKPKTLSSQLIIGAIVFPLMTIICTFIFYLLELVAAAYIQPGTFLGDALFTPVLEPDLTPLLMVGFILSYIIFFVYYLIMDSKLRRKQVLREKFIVLPFAIYSTLFFVDYYLLGIFNKLFNFTINSVPEQNIFQDFRSFNLVIVGVAIGTYYFKLLIANAKVMKFEQDLTQRIKIGEWMFLIVMAAIVLLPGVNWLVYSLSDTDPLYDKMLIQLLVVAQLILTVLIVTRAVMKNKKNQKKRE